MASGLLAVFDPSPLCPSPTMRRIRRTFSALALIVASFVACLTAASIARAAADFSAPGPFAVGTSEITLTRPDSTTFTSQIFYPATSAGVGAPVDLSGGPLPVITFGHGFLQLVLQYQPTLEHLASHGYLVVASDSQVTFTPNHLEYSRDLRQGLDYFAEQNAAPASPFFGGVNVAQMGAAGHSMGAGASLLAAADDPRIKAVINLAAAETNPSAIAVMPNINVPVSLLSGSADAIVPVTTNGELMFAAGNAPRQLPVIQGGYHCGFQDTPFPFFCDSGPLDPAQQLEITRRQMTAFFDLYLKEDQSAWRQVWGPEALADDRLVSQLDPGVAISATDDALQGPLGSQVLYDFYVQNTGDAPNSFSLFVEDNAYAVTLSSTQTPVLDPGEVYYFYGTATVPNSFALPSDNWIISARSDADGLTRGFARLTTFAVPEPSAWALALMALGGFAVWVNLSFQGRA